MSGTWHDPEGGNRQIFRTQQPHISPETRMESYRKGIAPANSNWRGSQHIAKPLSAVAQRQGNGCRGDDDWLFTLPPSILPDYLALFLSTLPDKPRNSSLSSHRKTELKQQSNGWHRGSSALKPSKTRPNTANSSPDLLVIIARFLFYPPSKNPCKRPASSANPNDIR